MATNGNSPDKPDGGFQVPTDPITGLLTKALEVYGDVRVSANENRVTGQPVQSAKNGATPGTTAMQPNAPGTPPGGMSDTVKIALVVAGVAAVLGALYFLKKR